MPSIISITYAFLLSPVIEQINTLFYKETHTIYSIQAASSVLCFYLYENLHHSLLHYRIYIPISMLKSKTFI